MRGDSTFCNRFQQEGEYTFVIKDNPEFKIIIPKTSFMPKYSGLEIKSFEKGTKNQESLKYSPIISETPGSAPSEVEISISTKNKRKNILYNTYLEIFGKDKD